MIVQTAAESMCASLCVWGGGGHCGDENVSDAMGVAMYISTSVPWDRLRFRDSAESTTLARKTCCYSFGMTEGREEEINLS
jgi:hypothetical protein